jgi:hypothetical protein
MKLKNKYNSEVNKANLTLKKGFPWWVLLFLLLLPLVLFINIPKKITVQTIVDFENQHISDLRVDAYYPYRQFFNFNEFKFNYTIDSFATATTDINGVINLDKKVKVSLFQYLFYKNDSIEFSSSINCSNGSVRTILPRNCFKDTLFLTLKTELLDVLNFLVVDAESDEPLVETDVEVHLSYLNANVDTILKSSVIGEVNIFKVPVCCNIMVVGKRYGYENDSIYGLVADLRGEPEPTDQVRLNRTLYLKPIKEIIRFYVKELDTYQPILGATAELFIENELKQTTYTNLNGNGIFVPGEGEFDETHIVKRMQIHAYHRFYHDTLHPIIPITVETFNKGNEHERTAFLRPKKDSYTFRNTINDKCGSPLEGVTNYVKILTRDGSIRRDTIISNINGIFNVGGLLFDDKVYILAIKHGFDENSFTVDGQTVESLFEPDNTSQCEKDVDIPLYREEPPIPVTNCDETQAAGQGNSIDVRSINLGKQGQFTLTYDMKDTYPDRIIVYCGSGTDGEIIFDDHRLNANYVVLDNYGCSSNIITVEIIPDDSDNTAWDYIVTCAE